MAAKRKVSLPRNSSFTRDSSPIKKANSTECSLEEWTVHDVCTYLETRGLSDVVSVFEEEKISGDILTDLNERHLSNMGISGTGKILKILKAIKQLQSQHTPSFLQCQFKVFNDPIHGHIELHPLCVKIIDTLEFQRLRNIKQLGACYFVFPGASHNRFEHSIGVCHLAGQLVRILEHKQPELGISEADILCVEIAGLCHDLGHGPFSHMFDALFIPKIRKDIKWKHEDSSVKMFDYLIESNNLVPLFEEYGLTQRDREFIKEQIAGPRVSLNSKEWPYRGRSKSKEFLYEIVANKRNGIDVDKWDYFARDCHYLGIKNNFDHSRFMKFVRVIPVEGDLQICSRDKEIGNIYDMFHTRTMLHRRAYQHKVVRVIQLMITEAFIMADDFLMIPGNNGRDYKLSTVMDDMEAFTSLTDSIYYQILWSKDPNLKEARNLLRCVETRNLYVCIGQVQPPTGEVYDKTLTTNYEKEIAALGNDGGNTIHASDLIFDIIQLDYGMKTKNPIDNVRFYVKSIPDMAIEIRKEQVSRMLPQQFSEQLIRVYTRSTNKDEIEISSQAFKKWCQYKQLRSKSGDTFAMDLTPLKTLEMYQNKDSSNQNAKKTLNF